jgi:hypothetical protein
MKHEVEDSPELKQAVRKQPREIASAIAGMTKRRLALITRRDLLTAEIEMLDASLLPWTE